MNPMRQNRQIIVVIIMKLYYKLSMRLLVAQFPNNILMKAEKTFTKFVNERLRRAVCGQMKY